MPIFNNTNVNGERSQQNEKKMERDDLLWFPSNPCEIIDQVGHDGFNERRVLVLYTGGTIGMVNDAEGCKFLNTN